MAYSMARLVDPTQLSTTHSALYTVPNDNSVKSVVVKQIRASLVAGQTSTGYVSYSVVPSGQALSSAHRQADVLPVAMGSPIRDDVFLVLKPGDALYASATVSANVTLTADGVVQS